MLKKLFGMDESNKYGDEDFVVRITLKEYRELLSKATLYEHHIRQNNTIEQVVKDQSCS